MTALTDTAYVLLALTIYGGPPLLMGAFLWFCWRWGASD